VATGTPVPRGQLLRLGQVAVDDGDELGDVGQVGQRLGVDLADHARPDEGEPELLGAHE
jgi:hypothetical protein